MALDRELSPIRVVAERLSDADSIIDPTAGAALLSRRPRIAPEAYACVIFPGVVREVAARYEALQHSTGNQNFEIPAIYRSVLLRLNGAWIFQLSLYGLPPSMCQTPPVLDRSARQPLDLGTANRQWRMRYSADQKHFHFGSGPYSPQENVAYFLEADGSVISLLPGGKRVSEWHSIEAFLRAEISRTESEYPEFEDRMAATWTASATPKRTPNKKAPRR